MGDPSAIHCGERVGEDARRFITHSATVWLVLGPAGLVLHTPLQGAKISQRGWDFLLRILLPVFALMLRVELGWPQAVDGL